MIAMSYCLLLDLRHGEEWKRVRQSIAPKMMRPKTVEENIDNFNAVSDDAIARFVKLKQACGPGDHIPDLEGELSRFSTESKFNLQRVSYFSLLAHEKEKIILLSRTRCPHPPPTISLS